MTLVVTTASRFGITVLGDRAVTRTADGVSSIVHTDATKIFHSPEANISLAFWGRTELATGTLGGFASEFLERELRRRRPIKEVATILARQLHDAVRPLHTGPTTWDMLRRGVHVAGYSGGQPHIWHVHMGTRLEGKAPAAHEDFPSIHGGGLAAYTTFLKAGGFARVFNGFSELFDVVGSVTADLRRRLEAEFDIVIPAPTLGGQLAFERALARLCAELLLSADRLPQVGTEFDTIAFNENGRVADSGLAPTGRPLRPRRHPSDVTASTATSIFIDPFSTSSLDDRTRKL